MRLNTYFLFRTPRVNAYYLAAFLLAGPLLISCGTQSRQANVSASDNLTAANSGELNNEKVETIAPTIPASLTHLTAHSRLVANAILKVAARTDTLDSMAVRPVKQPAIKTTAVVSLKSAVVGPDTLPGSVLPAKRIIAFYGTPLSKRMGILGELPPSEMLAKLDAEVVKWQKADPRTPVQPALHLIAVTAQRDPGIDQKYRLRTANHVIDTVLARAQQRQALVFLDVQVGHSTLAEELPLLETYLRLPNVHLGIDAEFALPPGRRPGRYVGSFDAADINYATQFLADLALQYQLPPKLLIVHRYTQRMVTNYQNIKLNPYCQIVMHMDGWGSPSIKRSSYDKYIRREPVQYSGLKIFYRNDIKQKGWRLMKPKEILALKPKPYYIQYQ